MELFMSSIELKEGGWKSISIAEWAASAGPNPDRCYLHIWAQRGRVCVCAQCVCVCVEERQREAIGCPSKTGRLHFHRCRFCARGSGGWYGGRWGIVISRLWAEWWGRCFSPDLSRLPRPGRAREEISPDRDAESRSCLLWPDTWAHEIILLRVNGAGPLQSYLLCQGADLLILFLAANLQLAFKFQPKRTSWPDTCLTMPRWFPLPTVPLIFNGSNVG